MINYNLIPTGEQPETTWSKYYKEIESMGHVLERDANGRINDFALDVGFHNGPRCILCDETWCEHCRPEVEPCEKAKP
jgi:hypothetical protein